MKVGFIGIGAQKSATSWLHHVLSRHPKIAASNPKELNYFTSNYDRGTLWYEQHFDQSTPDMICGECSPTYFFSLSAPHRARAYNADMKLVVVLRDPVARAFSNHLHEIRKGHIPESTSFEKALANNPAYVAQSRYHENLDRWLDCFDRSALLVLIAEDIAKTPEIAFGAVCRHLGVPSTPVPDGLYERRHESVAAQVKWIQRVLRKIGDTARALGLGTLVKTIKNTPPANMLLRLNKKDLRREIPAMEDKTRTELTELFREDVQFVATLLDRQSLPWPTWDACLASGKKAKDKTTRGNHHAER